MKKFKQFRVKTHGIKSLTKALVKHAKHLGYEFDDDWGDYNFLYCSKDGKCFLCRGVSADKITLDEFFNLAPKDVVVEPERFDCELRIETLLYSKCLASQSITECQINRIKAIMGEDDE